MTNNMVAVFTELYKYFMSLKDVNTCVIIKYFIKLLNLCFLRQNFNLTAIKINFYVKLSENQEVLEE